MNANNYDQPVRDKWKRKDYSQRTISKPYIQQKDVFNGSKEQVMVEHIPTAPEPLPTLPDVLPFDYSYLPDALRDYVSDISERMQCPPDFPAIATLVMIAGVIGRKVGIRPKKKDDWTIIPNLWGVAIGNSGIKKTPALNEALLPLEKLQSLAFEAFNAVKAEHDAERDILKVLQSAKRSQAISKLKKDDSADMQDIRGILKIEEAEKSPILKRYITNDVTYEKLGEIIFENSNGVVVVYDEIIGLLKNLDKSGQEVARSFYLSGANGNTSCTFDRIGRGTLNIPAVCLSIIGGIQPGVLAEYVKHAVGGGAGADGLLQRFSLMVYPDISTKCNYVDRAPNIAARDRINVLIEKIDKLNPVDIDAEIDLCGGVPFLRFEDEAQLRYSEWTIQLETRLRSGEEHPAIVSHLAKYQKLIPSLALIYHVCDSQSGSVSKTALQRAIAFSEYLESHARRVYSYATRPEVEVAKRVLGYLKSGKLRNPFKRRELHKKGWAGLDSLGKTQAALNLLVEYGHLILEEKNKTGGRPTTLYHWIQMTEG